MSTIQGPRGSHDPARVVLFTAPANAGRPVAVAVEVAWMLATAGHRVLLIDAGTAGPGSSWPSVPAHLGPFPFVERFELTTEEQPVAALGGTTVVRYLLPEPGRALDVLLPGAPGGHPSAPAEVRAAMGLLRFAYLLISVPLQRCATEPDLFAAISDLAVVSFPAVPSAAQQAGQVAHRIRETGDGPELVGVACYPEGGDPALLADRRGTIRKALAPPDRPEAAPPVVELLDRHYAAARPVLPVLFDEPGADQSSGYGQLLAAVTGTPTGVPAAPARVRRRYRRRLGGETNVEPSRIWVCYPPALQGWGEWVTGELTRWGAPASPLTGPPDPEVTTGGTAFVLLGPVDGLPGPVREGLSAHLDRFPVETRPEVFQVTLPGAATGPGGSQPYGAARVDLSPAGETVARRRLLAPFILTPPAGPEPAPVAGPGWPARFPGGPAAAITNAPPPSRDFVGRERELTLLRDGLLRHRVQLLAGPAAVGKSEIARVYAGRFGFDYDVVWWVPARDRPSIQSSLAQLAARLEDPLSARLGAVRRWLLIFDDADDPALLPDLPDLPELRELLQARDPASAPALAPARDDVHVVITSRQVPDPSPAAPIEVTVMDPVTGTALLARRHPALARHDADALVARLGGQPLALRLAATALRERLAELRAPGTTGSASSEQAVRSYLETLAGPPVSGTAAAVRATAETLRGAGPHGVLALWLARMCVYLSPDGISLDLLRTSAMTEALAGLAGEPARDVLTSDLAVIDAVVWLGARSGLLDVDWGRDSRLRIHRVVQQELAEATPADDQRRCSQAVITGLTRNAPNDAELEMARHQQRMDELRRQLEPSGALVSGDRGARRWLLSQIQYTARYGSAVARREDLRTAEAVGRRWAASEPERDADLRLRLDAERARLHHELGEYAAAAELQTRTQEQLRVRLGVGHLRTLLSSRSAARYLRWVGRLPEARIEDNVAHEGLARLLGRGHPNTLRAANMLAYSMFLAGEIEDAERLQRDIIARSGADTPINILTYRSNLGMYHRELGQYDSARSALTKALDAVHRGEQSTAAVLLALRISRNLALIHRWQDKPYLARRDHQELLGRYLDLLGPDHPETLAARLALAADECAEGAVEAAIAGAETAYQDFTRVLPDGHPYLHLCQLALGAFRLAAKQSDAARAAADQAWQGLTAGLGELHPWTLAAAANRLNVQAAAEPLDTLTAAYDSLAHACDEYLTPAHPYSRVVSANRAAVEHRDPAGLRPIIVDVPSV